jgi:putative CocE/NonD family hydrolase
VFETAPLREDLEVTGEISVTLWASSSARDTDFTAKLVDVYPSSADWPDGFALNLEDGIVRARFRDAFPESFKHGTAAEELLTPGQPYKLTIRLYPTSNIFKKGHRIRLDVSSSNYPRFDVNPNTGEPLGANTHVEVAVNTLHLDRFHASYVILPVIPRAGGAWAGLTKRNRGHIDAGCDPANGSYGCSSSSF